jgi:O-antigen/teichoic acid export membrane protein
MTGAPGDETDQVLTDSGAGDGSAPSSPRRSLSHRVVSSSIALWGSTALGFVGTVVAARALGPPEYGKVALALATATLVATLFDVTLETGVVHHGSRALARGEIGELRTLIRGAFVIDIAIGVVISGAMVVLAAPIAEVASAGRLEPSMIQLAALTTLGATMDGTTSAVLLLADRPELRAWAMAGTNLARLACILFLALTVDTAQAVVAAYAAGTAVGGVCQAVLAWHVGWRRWPQRRERAAFRPLVRKLVPFAVHSSLSTTIVSASDSVIQIVLGRASGTTAVALFRVARLPEMVGGLASAPIRLVMFSENAKSVARGRIDELERMLYRWSAVSLAVAVPAAIAGWFILPPLIKGLYGEEFADAATAARILLVTAVLLFAFPWMRNFAAVIGRPQIASALAAVLLIVALPITAIYAEHGQDAAAAGVSSGVVAMTVGYLWVARRYFKRHRGRQAEPAMPSAQAERGVGSSRIQG